MSQTNVISAVSEGGDMSLAGKLLFKGEASPSIYADWVNGG